MIRARLVGTVFCCVLCVTAVAAQRRAPGSAAKVQVSVDLVVAGDAYKATGEGTCRHAAQAAIYGVLSEQWSVQHSEGSRNLSLTLWRPKRGGGDMLTLAVSTGAASRQVNTVKADAAPPAEGSGTATLAAAPKGGTFTIDAATAKGERITGTIKCEAFTPAVAEGGD